MSALAYIHRLRKHHPIPSEFDETAKTDEDEALAGPANGSGDGDAGVMSAVQSAPTDGAASCVASGGGGLSTAAVLKCGP